MPSWSAGYRRTRLRVEWPTAMLAAAIYGGWLIATAWFHALPPPVRVLAGGWLVAWHGSLQHETIHGHPTRSRPLNALVGGVPLSLWLPYGHYRRTHRAHHRCSAITDPLHDPESRYLGQEGGQWHRRLAMLEATLLGRLLIGPPLTVFRFLGGEVRALGAEPARVRGDWLPHLAGVAVVIGWLHHCGIGLAGYLACFVYPGTALTLLRSFAEHRAARQAAHRVAVVERAGPLALLFLHNNLHAAHHEAPGLPWYRLPGYYRRHRARLLAANGGLAYAGYGEVARRYLLRPHDVVVHPDHAAAG